MPFFLLFRLLLSAYDNFGFMVKHASFFFILLFTQLQNFDDSDTGGNQVITHQPMILPSSRPSTSTMPPPSVYSSSRGQCSAPILCYLEMVFFLVRGSV
jgi:hypothetical protein